MILKQILHLTHRWDSNRVDLEIMVMNGYFQLPRSAERAFHHQMQF